MGANQTTRQSALGAISLVFVAAMPSCVIRIGPGGEEDGDGFGGFGGSTSTAGVGTAGGTPELPPEDPFVGTDPQERARMTVTATYAAAATASLVEAQVPDPHAIDPAALEALFAQYAPIATDQALAWVQSVDPSVFPADVPIKMACMNEPYDCDLSTFCPWVAGGAQCYITECGLGSCPYCPIFGNLLIESWCAYTCVKGGNVVGGAYSLRAVTGGHLGPICVGK